MNICGRINAGINGLTNDLPESFGSSDLVIFKPRFFVEGNNQFNYYHFVIPNIEIPSFFADNKEINIHENTILPTNPGQKLRVSPINKIHSNSNDIKFVAIFIEPRLFQEFTKEVFNKADLLFYNNTAYFSNSFLTLVSKFETEFYNKQFGYQFILDSLAMEITINLIRDLKSNMP